MRKIRTIIFLATILVFCNSCHKNNVTTTNNGNGNTSNNSMPISWEYTIDGVNYSYTGNYPSNTEAKAMFTFTNPGGAINLSSPTNSNYNRDKNLTFQICNTQITGIGTFVFNTSTYTGDPNTSDIFSFTKSSLNGNDSTYNSGPGYGSSITLNITRYDPNSVISTTSSCNGLVTCAGYVDGTFSGTIAGKWVNGPTLQGGTLAPKQINGSFHALRMQ